MISALNNLAAALPAISAYSANTAQNIVNVDTPGFKKNQGAYVSQNLGGGLAFQAQEVTGRVNLAEEIINLKQAEISYQAAAKTFASLNETEKRVMDTLG